MPRAVAVAASGGRDSTALLHCTAQAARQLGVAVHALHVHHGLMPEADAWLAQVRAQSRRWGAAFHAVRLQTKPGPGDSVEAWARRERYRALAAMARAAGCGLVLLAHHRRDQAETLLLQALRGGGPAGLAAMPALAQRDGLAWARPWLDRPREAIEAYVQRHRLRFVDDGSNDDPRFARNRLRRQLWPALQAAFPDAELQLQAAARRAAESDACLRELAEADAGQVLAQDHLLVEPWLGLGDARRRLLLRHWLRAAPDTLVQRLALELPAARSGTRWPAPGGELRLHDGRLQWHAAAAVATVGSALSMDLSQPGARPLPGWHGTLHVLPVARDGVAPQQLQAVRIAARAGGEQFQLAPRGVPRALKKQFQSRRVPAWQREGPLVFSGHQLVFVPGLGIDARCRAASGQPQLALRWEPGPAG